MRYLLDYYDHRRPIFFFFLNVGCLSRKPPKFSFSEPIH